MTNTSSEHKLNLEWKKNNKTVLFNGVRWRGQRKTCKICKSIYVLMVQHLKTKHADLVKSNACLQIIFMRLWSQDSGKLSKQETQFLKFGNLKM